MKRAFILISVSIIICSLVDPIFANKWERYDKEKYLAKAKEMGS